MKKFLSVLLSLIMVLSLVPMTAFASDEILVVTVLNIVDTVEVYNIVPPIAGRKWQGYQPAVSSDSPYSIYGSVEWYDETEKRILKNNETYQLGHIYTVQISLEVKDGYEFNSTATEYKMKGYFNPGTNAIEAKLSKAFEYQRWAMVVMSYTFPAVEKLEEITYVAINDVIEPKIGRQSIARAHYLKYSNNVEGIKAFWLENYDWDNHFTGVFKEGKRYTFVVDLAPKEGFCFGYVDKILVSINGKVAEVRFNADGTIRALYDYKTGKEPEKVKGVVTFNIDPPVLGGHPSFEAKDNRDDGLYYINKQHENSTKNGITWYEGVGDNERKMTETDTFKAGENYYVAIQVKPIQGYEFDTDEEGDLLISGAINGANSVIGGNEESLFVGYAFTPLKEAEKETEKEPEPEKTTETEKPQETKDPTETEKPTATEKPKDAPTTIFTDISKGQYYYDAVLWAAENGITGGTSANTFSPDANCSRGQVVTFLHRMIGSPEPAAITLPFADVKASDYFYKPVKWAYGSKITGGTSDTTFSPDETCSRAQVVTFLWRTAGQPEPNSNKNPFTDVKADSYYYNAVLWAVENGITGGTGADTFSPDADCTRAQVVTFLYRFIKGQ